MDQRAALTRDEAERVARKATQEALGTYEWISESQEEKLVLGTSERDGAYVFRLHVAGKRPEDAYVPFSATVDRFTRDVSVNVFLPLKSKADPREAIASSGVSA